MRERMNAFCDVPSNGDSLVTSSGTLRIVNLPGPIISGSFEYSAARLNSLDVYSWEPDRPGFKSWFRYFLLVGYRSSYFISKNLRFPMSK